MISLLVIPLLSAFGSRPSDIQDTNAKENPLPACPDSPNCIRTTKQINHSIDTVFTASVEALEKMGPIKMKISKEHHKIKAVFRVFIFKDDLILQLTPNDTTSTYLHIRSASRTGKSDLGVNTRRVKTFLNKVQSKL